jgi:hypothetical protein
MIHQLNMVAPLFILEKNHQLFIFHHPLRILSHIMVVAEKEVEEVHQPSNMYHYPIMICPCSSIPQIVSPQFM